MCLSTSTPCINITPILVGRPLIVQASFPWTGSIADPSIAQSKSVSLHAVPVLVARVFAQCSLKTRRITRVARKDVDYLVLDLSAHLCLHVGW